MLFPPFSTEDESTGKCVGRGIDITKSILADYDIEVDVICVPTSRLYRLVENGEVDLTVNQKTNSFLIEELTYINIPAYKYAMSIYTFDGDQTKNKKLLSAVRSFQYMGFRKKFKDQGYRFVDLPDSLASILMFNKRRTDYLLGYNAIFDYYTREAGIIWPENLTSKKLKDISSYYGVSKRSKHRDKLLHAINDYGLKNKIENFYEGK
jgi:polar amino acid transport system substrate-binding protein